MKLSRDILFNKKVSYFFVAALLVSVPYISAMLFCMKDGKTINDIAIYLGGWSDEITYYKQIEGMVEYGLPRGYFGYNQSRAVYGPFGVWGIFPLLPYWLVGSLIGFDYCTMMYINILMCTIALSIFIWLVRPNKRTMMTFGILWILYYELNRYVLSAVVESIFISFLIVILSLGCYLLSDKVRKNESRSFGWKKDCVAIITIVLLISYISICRPYYTVLFLIPLLALWAYKKRTGCVLISIVALLNIIVFFINYKYFCSKYYKDMLAIDSSLGEGMVQKLVTGIKDILKLIWYSLRYEDKVGWYYLIFFGGMIGIVVSIIYMKIRHKKLSKMFVSVLIGFSLVILSIILLYDVGVGTRHVLALNVGCILLLCIEMNYKWSFGFAGICLASILLIGKPDEVPYTTKEYAEYMEELALDLQNVISVTDELSYDNVVAMPTQDFSVYDENQVVTTYYGNLYAIPAGMGISVDNYGMYEDLEEVVAKYIMCHPEGVIRKKLESANKLCIYENEQFVIYEM